MNKDLKQGLIVAGVAVVAYLLYKQYTKPKDVVLQSAVVKDPFPIAIDLPVEDKPIESVVISAPLNM